MNGILVTGACGQIGSELTPALRKRYGGERVVATDIAVPSPTLREAGPFEFVDVTEREAVERVVERYRIGTIYQLAAILSASGESRPRLAWRVNVDGLRNVLEVALDHGVSRIFYPSSMAVFGPGTPCDEAPQESVTRPVTMYGVTKVAGEMLCDYCFRRFGLDVRGIRFPGIVSSETCPGGGTTDYAVHLLYAALRREHYTCFVREDTVLPMLYMPDCVRATIALMEADLSSLKHHAGYNLAGVSFSAGELVAEIGKHVPGFGCEYVPDYRQEIADSWPRTIDDSAAREEWGWETQYDLAVMVCDALTKLEQKRAEGRLEAPGVAGPVGSFRELR
jgi:nucleoside-diphosphate-sugar epimerase